MDAIDTRQRRDGETVVQMEIWFFLTLGAVALALVVFLWSVQRGRKVHLVIAEIDHLAEALPSIAGATHGSLLPGNRVQVLQNGDGFFPRLLEDLAAAQVNIHLETYVWWQGEICRRVAELLAAKAREGVEVRVLLDASGSARMDKELYRQMEEAGCKVAKYRPLRLSNLGRLNGRDHRKIVVVDGRVGYTFGHGIADEWLGNAQDKNHWRDTGVRVEGPIVGSLQSAFTENWVDETGEVLYGERHFPRLAAAGTTQAHLAYHFQHGTVSAVDLLYRLTFAAAQRELLIQNPYLVPDREMLELLARAADRGVDVRLMVPGEVTDTQFVRHAGHHLYAPLLRRGVRIYEYQPTLNHQKVMVVDELWSHVGSTNLDNRSFESNDEVSLGIVDPAIAAELRAAFFADLRHCVEIDLAAHRARGLRHRLLDWSAYRFNELL
jgi:cardiolipin synthase